MNEGDLVVSIGNRDVKWMPHDEVVSLIRDAGNTLNLTLVTPCDKTYYKLPKVWYIKKHMVQNCEMKCSDMRSPIELGLWCEVIVNYYK